MISENDPQLKSTYRNSQVIRKGEPGWKSDHPHRRGENYGTNPTSRMDQKIKQRREYDRPQGDPNELPLGSTDYTTFDGRDIVEWRVAEVRDLKRRALAEEEGAMMRVWRKVAVHKNGAL